MNREEFDNHWRQEETSEFAEWFTSIYGYDCSRSEEDKYWEQRVFANKGWRGSKEFYSENYYDKALSDASAAIEELKQR